MLFGGVCCILFGGLLYVVWRSALCCFLPMCQVDFLWSQNWVLGISSSLLLQLHEVKQGDKERSRMCVTLSKGRNVCFVPKKGHNTKVYYHGEDSCIPSWGDWEVVILYSSWAISTHLHLHIISKTPLFSISSSYPAPSFSTMAIPTAHNQFRWVAIYVILPCIIYPHFLACLFFLDCTGQACSIFGMVWATLGKFGLHMGNVKFHTQNEECICVIICWISPVFLLYIMCNKYVLVMIEFWKVQYSTYAMVSLFLAHFKKRVMYVIINIHLLSFQNFCGVLSHLCQGKG
jgi:hypothetical protein